MSKPTKHKPVKLDVTSAIIVAIALILGFTSGLLFSHFTSEPTKTTQQLVPLPHICNCPEIPAGESPSIDCRCAE